MNTNQKLIIAAALLVSAFLLISDWPQASGWQKGPTIAGTEMGHYKEMKDWPTTFGYVGAVWLVAGAGWLLLGNKGKKPEKDD